MRTLNEQATRDYKIIKEGLKQVEKANTYNRHGFFGNNKDCNKYSKQCAAFKRAIEIIEAAQL